MCLIIALLSLLLRYVTRVVLDGGLPGEMYVMVWSGVALVVFDSVALLCLS